MFLTPLISLLPSARSLHYIFDSRRRYLYARSGASLSPIHASTSKDGGPPDPDGAQSALLSVLIPVRNAAVHIQDTCIGTCQELDAAPFVYEVVYIDDASDDGTAEILADLVTRHSSIHVVRHTCHRGKSEAVLSGIEKPQGYFLIFLDDDIVLGRELVAAIVEPIVAGADLVNGWRRGRLFSNPMRSVASAFLRRLFLHLSAQPMRDPTSPVKCVRKDLFDDIERAGWLRAFPLEYAALAANRILEVPIENTWDTDVPSRYSTFRLACEFLLLSGGLLSRLPKRHAVRCARP